MPVWSASQVLRRIDNVGFAALDDGRGLHLDVRVSHAAELERALRFYTGTFDQAALPNDIIKASSKRAFIPFRRLSPVYRRQILMALWPSDRVVDGHYHHVVTYAGHETLWSIAAWFTSQGKNHSAVAKASGVNGSRIVKGSRIRIPVELLDRALIPQPIEDKTASVDPILAIHAPINETTDIADDGATIAASAPDGRANKATVVKRQEAPAAVKTELAVTQIENSELRATRQMLRYGTDRKGRYAEYRLRRGEAIYSAVVVRFCGLVSGEDVNRVAGVIIDRNGIRDETDLPVGYSIRIPYELIEPEFRADDDPEYLAYLKNFQEVSKLATKVVSRNLQGVYVIIDSGHGGRDTGAKFGSVWEDDFVYDIVCRVKQRLERETEAIVIPTILDPSVQYRVQDVSKFKLDHDEQIQTTPPYPLNHARVASDGVNLRWMFANYQHERLMAKGVKPENMVFASFHADSLHHSLRGAMVYVPDARYYPATVGPSKTRFSRFKESSGNHFTFSKHSMQDAQARSQALAQEFIQQAKLNDVMVHRSKPIRSVIRRHARSRPFVPAVLRYNRIPTRCLIEVCNLANQRDRELLTQPAFRQRIADTFVSALYQTYGLNEKQVAQNAKLASTVQPQ